MLRLDAAEAIIDTWASGLGQTTEALFRLLVAGLLGGIIGAEREIRGHPAGFRTFMLVTIGAALAMIVSISFAETTWLPDPANQIRVDPARIAYGVMSGVGFLGAGTIIHSRSRVRGLTTAAGIWATAAVGMVVGFGMYVVGIAAAVMLLIALTALNLVGDSLPSRHTRSVRLAIAASPDCLDKVREILDRPGVSLTRLNLLERASSKTVVVEGIVTFFRWSVWQDMCNDLLKREDVQVKRLR